MTYRERREARAERLRGWAEKREHKQPALDKAARCDEAHTGIPLGQPILIGHHSERRHRAALAKTDRAMRASIDNADKAREMSSRADEIEHQDYHAIYSDDPDAIERLREKLAGLEAQRAQRVEANAAFRRTHKAELKDCASAYARSCLMPYPAYSLQNLSGNITRARQRIEALSGQPARATVATVAPQEGDTATARAGLVVTANMTTPSRPGKAPRAVWNVTGNLANWRQMLIGMDGSWYRGAFSFWEDPSQAIETACAETEAPCP